MNDINTALILSQAELSWKADEKVRKEFQNDFDAYLAFFQAVAAGRVNIIRDRTVTDAQ